MIGISLTVYSRSGRQGQFQAYLELAQQYQVLAGMEKDPFRQYDYWKKSLENVVKAEEYGAGSAAASLHELAQNTVDSLDLSRRLEFRPALTSKLPETYKHPQGGSCQFRCLPVGWYFRRGDAHRV